jgi:hypothetical protein
MLRLRAALLLSLFGLGAAACGAPRATPVQDVLEDVALYYGKTVTVRARLKSGARCRQGEDGEWKTYCKDCQYCRGPMVVDLGGSEAERTLPDWPLVLGGTWEYQDIRCKGPLNEVKCHPFVPGQTYVIRGVIEATDPPKLIVSKWWPVD